MNYQQALAYIHSVSSAFCKPGLDRIRALCSALGNPERDLTVLHVAGTNGKGSFCAMTEAILRAAGYKTGLFTSPYIKEFNERMQINGESIANDELVELTELVRPVADAMQDKPTEFELITAIGFLYFKRHACDVVILETGLGGRLDSTNVVKSPLLSVITGIDFDHTQLLGNTIAAIAAEKGGIIKEGRPCLYGGNDNSACRILSSIAAAKGSAFHTVDRSRLSVAAFSPNGTRVDFGELRDLQLSLLGAYQPRNMATVLSALEILAAEGISVSEEAIRRGLASVRWPARFERLREANPIVFFDGGHNPNGIRSVVESLNAYFPEQKVCVLSGVMADKGYDEMIELLRPVTRKAFTVTPENPRSLPAAEYAAHFRAHGVEAESFSSIEQALLVAMEQAAEQGVPLLCVGSLYLYRSILDCLERLP